MDLRCLGSSGWLHPTDGVPLAAPHWLCLLVSRQSAVGSRQLMVDGGLISSRRKLIPKLRIFSLNFLEIPLRYILCTLSFKGYKIYRIEILEK